MRIRTIKPEFWQSETMASIPKESRLLAIALLNYADDQGYFYVVPQVIRGALFPFDDDSTTIRRGLDDLSRCGYIRSGTSSDGKKVCHIINFREHQKIDKPQPSKIAASGVEWGEFDEHSTNAPRTLDEQSSTEWNGMEKERNGTPPIVPREQKPKAPPTEQEVLDHCKAKHPDWHESGVIDLYRHYVATDWTDKDGKPIKNWKNKFSVIYGFKKEKGNIGPTEEFTRKSRESQNSNPEHRMYMKMKVERDYAE